jgi:hypothetical protein
MLFAILFSLMDAVYIWQFIQEYFPTWIQYLRVNVDTVLVLSLLMVLGMYWIAER